MAHGAVDERDDAISLLCVSGWSGAAAELTGRLVAARDRFERTFERDPYVALETVGDAEIDCVVASYTLSDLDGLSLLASVRAEHPDLPFVLVAADGSEAVAARAVSMDVTEYVRVDRTGTDATDLADRIATAVSERRTDPGQFSGPGNPLTAVFEEFPEPTFAYEFDETRGAAVIRAANDAFVEVFGYDRERAVDSEVDELIVPPDRQTEADAVDEQVRAGERVDATLERQAASGLRVFRFRNIPLAEADPVDGFAVYADVTERQRRQREAAERRHQLERQNDQLEQLISVISHDLRSPLNVAAGRVDMARRERSGETESLDTAAEAIERMDTIVEDALSLARTGRTVTETESVTLASLVDACWGVIDGPDATLESAVDGLRVECDRGRLRHLFENLFRNAVEHGDGETTVHVGTVTDAEGEPVGFFVADDGPGIPPEDREAVFEPSYTTSESGTGLGLSIVAGVVDAHDWSISVAESAAGGARFEVTDLDVVDD
ncbi:ATP-binding protein [Halobaculum sp. MBLA0147]|uniref:hybrid sensor histidine kinase/response regulator n=1 Tax=Halobaculum sp. MBLA0147 TaxID=3079934 RepID=UPI0035239F1A